MLPVTVKASLSAPPVVVKVTVLVPVSASVVVRLPITVCSSATVKLEAEVKTGEL